MSLNWVTITPVSGTSGTTTVQVTVGKNSGNERNGSIEINGATYGNSAVLSIKQKEFNYATEPLTFDIVSGGKVLWKTTNESFTKQIQYRLNDGEWTSISPTTGGTEINVSAGDKLQFLGDNAAYADSSNYCYFNGDAYFDVSGNIMSLVNSGNFSNVTTLSGTWNFKTLFTQSNVVEAENLILPATVATGSCYRYMFSHCLSMVSTPKLPATTVNEASYQGMFQDCPSLTATTEMSATTFIGTNGCYRMYQKCTGITTAKPISATTVGSYTFYQAFDQCSSLITAPELPATAISTHSYDRMFTNCTNLVNAPSILPATTLYESCYYRMFENCSSLVNAPELPATTLATYCYDLMFSNCTSLVKAPALPATTLANYAYYRMFDGCTSLNYIKCLATNISATSAVTNWVRNVAPTGTFVKNPSMNGWAINNNSGIPIGWTVIDYYEHLDEYLTIDIIEYGSTIKINNANVSYSVNGGQWQTTTGSTTLTTNLGDRIRFKGTNGGEYLFYGNTYSTAGLFAAEGNVMSLIYGDDFVGKTDLSGKTFIGMFKNCQGLLNKGIILPATTLANGCYEEMFGDCYRMTDAPALPATALTEGCYWGMFKGCSSLSTAPELPATTLANGCYDQMFLGCWALTTTPVLPATTLAESCYYSMFAECRDLNYVKCLATDISAGYALTDWLSGVSSTGTFVKATGVTWPSGTGGIPDSWTVQEV